MTKVAATNINVTNVDNKRLVNSKNTANKPVFHFNGMIEPTKQGENAIDCWLLSGLNALNQTSWGKKYIKEAIKPDGDGGVYITFPGSPIEQKTFHVSVEELYKASQSDKYSKGDDDVLAIEVATEKLFKTLYQRKIGTILFEYGNDSYLGNFIDKNNNNLTIEKLLTNRNTFDFNADFCEVKDNNFYNALAQIANISSKSAICCSFDKDQMEYIDNDEIIPFHLYSIKTMVDKKYIIVHDPIENKDIKLPWYKFGLAAKTLCITPQNKKDIDNISSALTQDYKNKCIKHESECKEYQQKIKDKKAQLEKLSKFIDIANAKPILYLDLKSKIENGNYEQTLSKINSLNDEQRFCILYKDTSEMIKLLDNKAWGWGNGSKKKALIEPFINSLCNIASDYICVGDIEKIKKTCLEELNATFYTDEEKIIENMELLKNAVIREINNKYQQLVKETEYR